MRPFAFFGRIRHEIKGSFFAGRITGAAILTPCGFLDGGLGFAVVDPLFDRRSLVVLLFAFTQRDLDFHESLFEIHAQRHDRDPLAPGLPDQTVDLAAFEQEFPRPGRIQFLMSLDLGIGRNMAIHEKGFLPHDTHVTVFQIHAPLTDGLDLMPHEAHARLILVMDEIVVVGLPVLGNYFERIPDGLACGDRIFFLFHKEWYPYSKMERCRFDSYSALSYTIFHNRDDKVPNH